MIPRSTCQHGRMEGGCGGRLATHDRSAGTGVAVDVLETELNPEAIPVELPPVSGSHHYLPALDGLRALAVTAVVAYHFGFHWADGGYLGVDLFFVLSGFLITGLLIGEWQLRPGSGSRSFWFRRAKRLLPAVMLLLIVLSIYSRLGGPNISRRPSRPDGIATLFYYANWHLIFTHQSYFAQFDAALPAAPHLVARDRGAVLPGVAAPPAGGRSAAPAGGPPGGAPTARPPCSPAAP